MAHRDSYNVSILPAFDEETGTYYVKVMLTNLPSEREALAAADYIASVLCGEERKVQ